MDEFIANHVLRTCDGLTSKYDREESSADIYERLREYELMVLLEFHMIKKEPGKIDETDVCFLSAFGQNVSMNIYCAQYKN